jgi:hypothetical protein
MPLFSVYSFLFWPALDIREGYLDRFFGFTKKAVNHPIV